jgi:hypothetical protein
MRYMYLMLCAIPLSAFHKIIFNKAECHSKIIKEHGMEAAMLQ